ncbi:hypothetical protein RQP46_000064 [Phenoliferia psychrophenolica]
MTILQAAVRSQETTYRQSVPDNQFLQILVSIREMDPPDRSDEFWQVVVRNFTAPVSPETFGTEKLANGGLTQVLYALDCILRSIYLGPSKWIGFLDLDDTSVHAPAELYPGFTYQPPVVPSPWRIVHLGTSVFTEGPYEEYNRSASVKQFLRALEARKRKVLKRMRLVWQE